MRVYKTRVGYTTLFRDSLNCQVCFFVIMKQFLCNNLFSENKHKKLQYRPSLTVFFLLFSDHVEPMDAERTKAKITVDCSILS